MSNPKKAIFKCFYCSISFEEYKSNIKSVKTFCSRACKGKHLSSLPRELKPGYKGKNCSKKNKAEWNSYMKNYRKNYVAPENLEYISREIFRKKEKE